MTLSVEDNEWASATGANAYSGGSSSRFDNPPVFMYDMTITSNPGDPNPKEFDIGNTYDVEYTVAGMNMTLEDATVIRRDAAPGGGGIVVLEGTNNFGQIAHMVWTPDFDLEGWYWDNFSGGQPPSFRVVDGNRGPIHTSACFAADTQIATPEGLRRAGDIRPGDRVLTLDAGLCPVRWVGQRRVVGRGRNSPIQFAPGSIGNDQPLHLSLQHRVLLRSAHAELLFASHEVLAPATALVDGDAVRYAPCAGVTYVHLLLDSHHILFAAGGAPCESLLSGDMANSPLQNDLPVAFPGLDHAAARPILTFDEARCLVGSGRVEMPVEHVML